MSIATVTTSDGQRHDVLRAVLTTPRIGAWLGSIWINATTEPTGKVTIAAGALSFGGTINRASIYRGVLRMRVVGGADGLRRAAAPKHYTSPTVRLVLQELCAGAGEALSPTADKAILGQTLLAWTTMAVETGAMVQGVIDATRIADAAWRLRADGSLWVGRESWPDSKLTDYRELEESPEDGWVVLGMDVPQLGPGTTFGGRKAEIVEHLITPEEYRAKVWVVP